MLQTLSIKAIDARPLHSLADLELKGAAFGVTAARNLLDQPNTPRMIADAPLSWRLASDFIIFEYMTALRQHGLDDEGEIAFRRGYDRGLAAQLANPNSRVEIKVKT